MDDSGNDFYYDDNYQLLTTEYVCVCVVTFVSVQ